MGLRINEVIAANAAGAPPAADTKAGQEASATAGRFPSGVAALYKLDKDGKRTALDQSDPVSLVNVSLSEVHIRTTNDAVKNPKGFEEKSLGVLPFGVITVPALHARRALETQEKPGGDPKLVVAPVNGDCKGEMTFKGYGKVFRTCPFAECKTCGPLPARTHWSVWQVQHRISMLGTEPAIRRVIETIDMRTPVVMWGLEIITQRTRAKQDRMGLVGQVNTAEVTF